MKFAARLKEDAPDKLHAGAPENRYTNQQRPEPAFFYNSHKHQRLPVIYSTDCNLLYRLWIFTCMSTICPNLYFAAVCRLKTNRERMTCSVIFRPVGGNTCILSVWVRAKHLLLQCQELFLFNKIYATPLQRKKIHSATRNITYNEAYKRRIDSHDRNDLISKDNISCYGQIISVNGDTHPQNYAI